MDIFNAIADPKRRAILEFLGNQGQLTASQIFEKFQVTNSAISQHLKVLKSSGLVKMEKKAQKRVYSINENSIKEINAWTNKLTEKLEFQYQSLDRLLEKEKEKLQKIQEVE